jgi:hypothetical protein
VLLASVLSVTKKNGRRSTKNWITMKGTACKLEPPKIYQPQWNILPHIMVVPWIFWKGQRITLKADPYSIFQ